MKVRIVNFQRIKDATLEFDKGLTVLVGPTNNGKSSVFRALDTAIFNNSSDSKVRKGCDSATIGILTDEHKVVWKRTLSADSKTAYQVDGKTLVKIGRGQPEEVKEALGIHEVQLLKGKEKLNFWKQMAYPFLLNKTPSQLYEFIALSSEEDNLTQIVNDMRSDLKDIDSNKSRLEGAIDIITKTFNREKENYTKKRDGSLIINAILASEGKIKELENLTRLCQSISESGSDYNNTKGELVEVTKNLDIMLSYTDRLDKLIPILDSMTDVVSSVEKSGRSYKETKNQLDRIDSVLSSMSLDNVESELDRLSKLETYKDDLSSLIIEVENHYNMAHNSFTEIKQIDSQLSNIELLSVRYGEYKKSMESTLELDKIILDVERTYKNIESLNGEISNIDSEIVRLEEELSEFKVCPLCGQELEGGHCNE